MLPIYCEQCGTEIIKDKRTSRRFCSQHCFGEYLSLTRKGIPRPEVAGPKPSKRRRVINICEKCGKEFEVKQSHAERRKRCSKECQREQRVLECNFCHKSYSVKLAEVERSHYCSKACHNDFMKSLLGPDNPKWQGGGDNWRGPNWVIQRAAARERDGNKCQHCGTHRKKLKYELDVHHIIPFRDFGAERYLEANDLTNLISLCRHCHRKAEYGHIPIQPRLV